jgi:hypothetical protein
VKQKYLLFLATLLSAFVAAPVFAAALPQEVQFDLEASMAGSRLIRFEKTYRGNFAKEVLDLPGIPDHGGPRQLVLHAVHFGEVLSLESPETGRRHDLTFTLSLSNHLNDDGSPRDYLVSASFGPGQPINEKTRESDFRLRDPGAFAGLEIRGELIEEEVGKGEKASFYPFLKIKNFKVLR